MGRYIGRGLDRATRPVAPTFSPDGYDEKCIISVKYQNILPIK